MEEKQRNCIQENMVKGAVNRKTVTLIDRIKVITCAGLSNLTDHSPTAGCLGNTHATTVCTAFPDLIFYLPPPLSLTNTLRTTRSIYTHSSTCSMLLTYCRLRGKTVSAHYPKIKPLTICRGFFGHFLKPNLVNSL